VACSPPEAWYARVGADGELVCDVVALDEFLDEAGRAEGGHARAVSLIKCDIEGADLFAMRDAKKTLETHHPTVIIDITPWYLEGFGLKVEDLTRFFEGLGYRCYSPPPHSDARR
jgi:hypothetical protein